MTTAIYKRVSTSKQEEFGVSLDTQDEKLRAYCIVKGLDHIKEYTDVGTGRNADRVFFKQLVEDIKAGKIHNVVVYRLDRLTRSISDLNDLIQLFNQYDCALHSASESLDTSTANGRLMINLIGLFAQWESETISERVTVNMQSLAEKGIWMSVPPFGFILGDDRKLHPCPTEAPMIHEALALVKKGHSFNYAENTVRRKYGLTWKAGFLARKVRQPTMVGDMVRNGVLIKNTHQGIISKADQQLYIDIISNNTNGRRGLERTNLFTQRIVCPQCGGMLSTRCTSSNNYVTKNYGYDCDRCRRVGRPNIYVAEKIIEREFLKHMQSLTFDGTQLPAQEPDNANEIQTIQKDLQVAEKARENVQRGWITGRINDEDYDKFAAEFDEEIAKLKRDLDILDLPHDGPDIESMRGIQKTFAEIYPYLEAAEKQELIRISIKKIHFERKKKEGYQKQYDVTVTNIEFLDYG